MHIAKKLMTLRNMMAWGKDNVEFRGASLFISLMLPLLNEQPIRSDWEQRVCQAALDWHSGTPDLKQNIDDYKDEPDLYYYAMFRHAVWLLHEGSWQSVADYFEEL